MTGVLPIQLRFAGYQGPHSPHTSAAATFLDRLSDRLGTLPVEVALQPDILRLGHATADLPTLMSAGRFEFCYLSTSYLARFAPEFSQLDTPYAYDTVETALADLDGPLGQRISEALLAQSGLRVLGYWSNGLRHLTNRVRPIWTPTECQGLRIRAIENYLHTKLFERLGFDVIPLDLRELMPAVEDGTVDAQDNSLATIDRLGTLRHHRYLTMTGHLVGIVALLCREATYQRWPSQVREAVALAAVEATSIQRTIASAKESALEKALAADPSIEVANLSTAERARFRARFVPEQAA
ncbi:MAG: TRAP transporter substrate-binding protein [Pseudomonadota bacterium]